MTKIYYDNDADLSYLDGKVITFVGYGNQGRAQALNLRDSGISDIIIGNIEDEYKKKAINDGFQTYDIETACKKGDIIFILIPDEVAPDVYQREIYPTLKSGDVLNFASGYNITYKFIEPPKDVDVIMVAPRMIGEGVRELYKEGFPAFVAVEQDASGRAKETALALAKGIGSTKKGAIETTFDDETYLDLIAEQATWPLILSVLTEVYKFEIEMGHPEEAVLMELYISKEPAIMLEKMAEVGMFKQLPLHSHTSQYGQLTRFESVDKDFIREFIKKQYENIKSGRFAREWRVEQESGLPVFKKALDEAFRSDISIGEAKLKEKLNLK